MTDEKKRTKEKREKHEHDEDWWFDSKRFRGPKSNKSFPAALFHYIKVTAPKDSPAEYLVEAASEFTDERVMYYYNGNFKGTDAAIPQEEVIESWNALVQKRAKKGSKSNKKKHRDRQDEGAASPNRTESEKSDKNEKNSSKAEDTPTASPKALSDSKEPVSPERRPLERRKSKSEASPEIQPKDESSLERRKSRSEASPEIRPKDEPSLERQKSKSEASPERRSSKDEASMERRKSKSEMSPERRQSKDEGRRGSKGDEARRGSRGDVNEYMKAISNKIDPTKISSTHISIMSAHSLDFELSESVVSQRRSTVLDAADDELVDTRSGSSVGSKDGSLQRDSSSNQNNQSFKLQPVASVHSAAGSFGGSLGGSLGEKSPLSSAPPTPIFRESAANSAPPTPIFPKEVPPALKEKYPAKGVAGGPVRTGSGRGSQPPKPPIIVKDTGGVIIVEQTSKKTQKEAKDVISLFNHQRILTSGSQALVFEDKDYRCRYDLQILANLSSILVTFYSAGQHVYTSTSAIDLGKHITSLYWTFAKPSESVPEEVADSLLQSEFWSLTDLNTNHNVLHLIVGSKSDKVTVLFSCGPVGSFSCYNAGKKMHTHSILTPKDVYQKK
eukprot:TRINITY_DN17208_c1_g1_i1.p1 TRINITY_DN17208_c1_g1~~TRINITY_DN17208_c1_g1_i1.p1  ORF type:complete len:615 (+),score=129.44 TRINITY_DN17208_c1_g1_i1:75-1919(+)